MAHNLSQPVRQEIFSALVEAPDQEMPVAQSRREIARRFSINDGELLSPSGDDLRKLVYRSSKHRQRADGHDR